MKPAIPIAGVAALILTACAHADPPRREASIPFADHGGVDDWRADGDETIYFKDQHRRWYRAELFGPCFDLPYAERIGIDARPSGALDRFGAIIVRGHRCVFRSFDQVEGPPIKRKGHRG